MGGEGPVGVARQWDAVGGGVVYDDLVVMAKVARQRRVLDGVEIFIFTRVL